MGKEGRPVPGHQGVTSPACQDRPASFVSRALLLARPLPPAAHPLTLLPFCLWTWGQECQGDSTSSFPAQPLGTHGQPGPSSGLSTLGAQRPIQRLCLLTTVRASCPTCPQQASPSLQPAPPHLSPRLAPPPARYGPSCGGAWRPSACLPPSMSPHCPGLCPGRTSVPFCAPLTLLSVLRKILINSFTLRCN